MCLISSQHSLEIINYKKVLICLQTRGGGTGGAGGARAPPTFVILLNMESKLFVPSKLTFSEDLRCLNFPLWILWLGKTKQV